MKMEGGCGVEKNNRVGIRQGLHGHVGRVGYVKRVIGKRKCSKKLKVKKSKRLVSMALQQLFMSCRQVFKGPGTVPFPADVQKLCSILDNMEAEDVGLCRDLQFFNPETERVRGSSPRVTYTTIYKCHNFELCILFVPANGVIPLHNHPGMTVFSKLLLGKMHIKSYDWVHPPTFAISDQHRHSLTPTSQLRLARLKADSVFNAPCDTSVLYPTSGGNMHAFTAITPCAVLDVLGPPYSSQDGRDCSYYKDHPYASFSNGEARGPVRKEESEDCYGWLEEIEMPENSHMDEIEYLGPQVMDI